MEVKESCGRARPGDTGQQWGGGLRGQALPDLEAVTGFGVWLSDGVLA